MMNALLFRSSSSSLQKKSFPIQYAVHHTLCRRPPPLLSHQLRRRPFPHLPPHLHRRYSSSKSGPKSGLRSEAQSLLKFGASLIIPGFEVADEVIKHAVDKFKKIPRDSAADYTSVRISRFFSGDSNDSDPKKFVLHQRSVDMKALLKCLHDFEAILIIPITQETMDELLAAEKKKEEGEKPKKKDMKKKKEEGEKPKEDIINGEDDHSEENENGDGVKVKKKGDGNSEGQGDTEAPNEGGVEDESE